VGQKSNMVLWSLPKRFLFLFLFYFLFYFFEVPATNKFFCMLSNTKPWSTTIGLYD
jgi:hypothetical protein